MKLSVSRDVFLEKKKEALTKVNSFRDKFEKRETKVKAELEEAGRILKELSERFKWWGSLP
ncbi:MAG: hypothetical protein Q8P64_21800 [Deltaproteobacteria bacterium]|nr:hypothetical protein [Deltaproteobacteria bacterium]